LRVSVKVGGRRAERHFVRRTPAPVPRLDARDDAIAADETSALLFGTLSPMLTPAHTYFALLIVQACHLLHHRVAKRHISFAEVLSAVVLCFPPFVVDLPAALFEGAHLFLIAVQVVGSVWIRQLSPDWR
jgi:hypothetical protein